MFRLLPRHFTIAICFSPSFSIPIPTHLHPYLDLSLSLSIPASTYLCPCPSLPRLVCLAFMSASTSLTITHSIPIVSMVSSLSFHLYCRSFGTCTCCIYVRVADLYQLYLWFNMICLSIHWCVLHATIYLPLPRNYQYIPKNLYPILWSQGVWVFEVFLIIQNDNPWEMCSVA